MTHDAKHTVKDTDKPFCCPYGSCTTKFGKPGRNDFGSHLKCRGKMLPPHLAIDLGAKPPLLGKLRLDEPTFKDMRYDDPNFEGWENTEGVVLPVKTSKPRNTVQKELNYKKLIYWCEELAVRVGAGEIQRFKDWKDLVDFFLTHDDAKVLHLGKEWLPTLTTELDRRGIVPKRFFVSYQVEGRCSFFNLHHYTIEALEDFQRCNHFIYGLTKMNLTDKLTAAQLGYEWWWRTEGCQSEIQILQGEDRKFASSAYYGARVRAPTVELRSSEADEIEAGRYSYEELLDEGAVEDIWIQGDVTSKYPYLMSRLSQSYYPKGGSRVSQNGAEEFAKGVVGIYEVEYTRPPGLKLAILPTRIWKGGKSYLEWITTPGTDTARFTEVDLQLALSYGYKLKFKGPCLLWNTVGHPYDSYVEQLFALRQSEQNPAVRTLIKHLMVVLYGKMAQKETGTIANMKRISADEAFDLIDAGRGAEFIDEDGIYYIREGEVSEKTALKIPTKPNHLGAYILSWSRKYMAELFHTVDYKFLATRTDSLLVAYPQYQQLLTAGYFAEGVLGKLHVEYGIIYATTQNHATKYTHHFLDQEGECQSVVKGKGKKVLEVVQADLQPDEIDSDDD